MKAQPTTFVPTAMSGNLERTPGALICRTISQLPPTLAREWQVPGAISHQQVKISPLGVTATRTWSIVEAFRPTSKAALHAPPARILMTIALSLR